VDARELRRVRLGAVDVRRHRQSGAERAVGRVGFEADADREVRALRALDRAGALVPERLGHDRQEVRQREDVRDVVVREHANHARSLRRRRVNGSVDGPV